MASIGLKILPSQGVGTNLGSVLAQSFNPEASAKATLLGTEAAAHEAYARKIAADQALIEAKTREEQNAEAERLRAGPLEGETLAGAVPALAPVNVLNPPVAGPEGWGSIGATHSVPPSPEAIAQHDRLVASNRALGPILVRGNPEQVAKGVNTAYGGAILSGAASYPAIVQPDALRIAGGLYSGTAPSTSTVWSGGDLAGVNAATAGDIAKERAKADLPHDAEVGGVMYHFPGGNQPGVPITSTTPTGTGEANQRAVRLAALRAKEQKEGLTVPEQQEKQALEGLYNKDVRRPDIQLEEKSRGVYDPNTQQVLPNTAAPPPKPPLGPYDDTKVEGHHLNVVVGMMNRMGDPNYRPTIAEANEYSATHNQLYLLKGTLQDINGVTTLVPLQASAPVNAPTPEQVFARVAAPPAGSVPPQAPPVNAPPVNPIPNAPPVAPPPAVDEFNVQTPETVTAPGTAGGLTVSILSNAPFDVRKGVQAITVAGKNQGLKEADAKNLKTATRALLGTAFLDQMKASDIPSALQRWIADPTATGLGADALQALFADPDTRAYVQASMAFQTAQLRQDSGAAINAGEFKQSDWNFIPKPGEDDTLLPGKAEARHAEIRSQILSLPDGPAKQSLIQLAKQLKVDLAPHTERMAVPRSVRESQGGGGGGSVRRYDNKGNPIQ